MYLRNAWYVAAWPSELNAGPLARTFLDEPVVLFRTEDGAMHALEDRCCHRNLPLSMGKVEGDNLRCGYHGLLFDRAGKVNAKGRPMAARASGRSDRLGTTRHTNKKRPCGRFWQNWRSGRDSNPRPPA